MEKKQNLPENTRKLQPNRTSKLNQKLASQNEKNKDNTSSGCSSKDVKIQKVKEKGAPDLKKTPSDAVAERIKETNKGDTNKDEASKQGRRRNKKQVNEHVGTKTKERKAGGEQLSVEKDELSNASDEQIDNIEAQFSKSKKRRIRKKRLLESLGINIINPANSNNTKSVSKKRKKKKSICADSSEKDDGSVVHETCRKSGNCSDVISNCVTDCWKDLKFDDLGKTGPIKKLESAANVSCCNTKIEVPKRKDIKSEIPKVKDVPKVSEIPELKRTEPEDLKLKDRIPEVYKTQKADSSKAKDKKPEVPKTKSDVKKVNKTEPPRTKISEPDTPKIDTNKLEKKSGNKLVALKEDNSCVKGCCEELPIRKSASYDSKSSLEAVSHRKTKHKEVDANTTGKVDLVNLLSHDNVEGLFRSALLNDVNLSSRCSEKEVKNFFNTYGTFSERGRTQFAAVEKLLQSSSEDADGTSLDKEKPLSSSFRNSDAFVDKPVISSDISAVPATLSILPNCDSREDLLLVSSSEAKPSQIVKGLCSGEAVFKGALTRGPIYTSPNLENRVTSSANSGQILNRPFFADAYKLCKIDDEDIVDSWLTISNQEKSELKIVDFSDCSTLSETTLDLVKDSSIKNSANEKNTSITLEKDEVESRVSKETPLPVSQASLEEGRSVHASGSEEIHDINKDCNRRADVFIASKHIISVKEETTVNTNASGSVAKSYLTEHSKRLDEVNKSELKKESSDCVSEKLEENNKAECGINRLTGDNSKPKSEIGISKTCEVSIKKEEANRLEIETKVEPNVVSESIASNYSIDNTATNSDSVISVPVLENNIAMKPSQVKKPEDANSQKTEKNREEIVAERAAKKDAKLTAKNKGLNTPSAPTKLQSASNKQSTSSVKKADPSSPKKPPTESTKTVRAPESGVTVTATAQVNEVTKEKKQIPSGAGEGMKVEKAEAAEKSKAELRAERRAKQEAQRAAKAAQQQTKAEQVKPAAQAKPSSPAKADAKEKSPKKTAEDDVPKKTTKYTAPVTKSKAPEHRVKLFNHLYNESSPLAIAERFLLNGPDLHPAIVKLGMQYADHVVIGSNARCIALLDALKQVIKDYETPPQKEFSRGLEAELQPSILFLDTCRLLSVSMTNALRYLKRHLTLLPNNVSDSEAKKKLLDTIDTYIREQIDMAALAIGIMMQKKIAKDDVILTYGCSSLVQRILLEAHANGTKFRVVVVDGWPWREGREMLRRLVENGIDCSYVLVTAASFIMREVTKVLLGAHALLANGYVMSRAGSSQVALLARSYNVPVLVCCETHKFCEKVQTDSFVYNELGNPDDLIRSVYGMKEPPLSKWRSIGSLTPLNLTYDVTPPDLVSAVVTELGILPCTSVPVVLRIKPSEIGS